MNPIPSKGFIAQRRSEVRGSEQEGGNVAVKGEVFEGGSKMPVTMLALNIEEEVTSQGRSPSSEAGRTGEAFSHRGL